MVCVWGCVRLGVAGGSQYTTSCEPPCGLAILLGDTSILHHVFLLLFIMFLSIIMLFGVILMPFLS